MKHVTFVFKKGEEHLAVLGHLLKPYIYTASCTGTLKLATSDAPILDDIPFFPLFGWFEGMDVTVMKYSGDVTFYISSKTENNEKANKTLTIIFPDLAKLKYNNDFKITDTVEGYNMKHLSAELVEKIRLDNIDRIAKPGSLYYMQVHAKKIATLSLIREEKTKFGYYLELMERTRQESANI